MKTTPKVNQLVNIFEVILTKIGGMGKREKTSISDEKFKEILIDGINSGANYVLNKSNFYEYIRTIHKMERQRSLRLYDKYYQEAQQERNRLKADMGIKKVEQAVNEAILTRNERMEIASNIAKGKAWRVGDQLMIPSASDRLKALEYLSKVDGDFAATKHDIKVEGTGVDGFLIEE